MITHRSRYSLTLDVAEMTQVLLAGFSDSVKSTVRGYSLESITMLERDDGRLPLYTVTFAREATPWS